MGEPQDSDNSLITLENDPIYYEGITPEELVETLHNSNQRDAIPVFFNNLHLHMIDPIYLQYDEPQFQKDLQETKDEGAKKYLKNYNSVEEALKKFNFEDEQYLLLSHIYIYQNERKRIPTI